MALYFGDQQVKDFPALLDRMPDDTLASPKRSTVPLLDYWRDADTRLRQLAQVLDVAELQLDDLHFEYSVPVQQGHGKASYTDLMVKSVAAAVAIEAKFTEPHYETVRAWLREPRSDNRIAVLLGWLGLIGKCVSRPIDMEDVLDLPYQLIHRVASVCSVGVPRRYVVYQVFGPQADEYYSEQLSAMARLVTPSEKVHLSLMSCSFEPSQTFADLEARWIESGKRSLAHDVREALRLGPLLEFTETTTTTLG